MLRLVLILYVPCTHLWDACNQEGMLWGDCPYQNAKKKGGGGDKNKNKKRDGVEVKNKTKFIGF